MVLGKFSFMDMIQTNCKKLEIVTKFTPKILTLYLALILLIFMTNLLATEHRKMATRNFRKKVQMVLRVLVNRDIQGEWAITFGSITLNRTITA